MTDDLMIGFEINTGQYIQSITIYEEAADPSAISEVKARIATDGAIYNLMGMKVSSNAKGLLIKDGKKL
ncbi:MAG: hypothetical protein K6G08_02860, partial [Prevotella sp.]|nr:hypothetical protein [Prevotella sp.]